MFTLSMKNMLNHEQESKAPYHFSFVKFLKYEITEVLVREEFRFGKSNG